MNPLSGEPMSETRDIGGRRELFVDRYLIAGLTGGAHLRLHEPAPHEVVFRADAPWEGSASNYFTVLREADGYRMYYQGWEVELDPERVADIHGLARHPLNACVAESDDGLNWRRPRLGLFEHAGSTANNIVWAGSGPRWRGVHGFAPFRDPNPGADPRARYKAIGAERFAIKGDLDALVSPDGLRWSLAGDEPILRQDPAGAGCTFDSQNLAFWDAERGEYRAYVRRTVAHGRDIATATSPDFARFSAPEPLSYPGAPDEELYTNAVMPYPRAPHIFVGFPTRHVERPWSPAVEQLPELEHRRRRARIAERLGSALTEGLFMSSRDGRTFTRFGEAFLRPGPQTAGNWTYGDNYIAWGMIETPSPREGAPDELSLFATEGKWRDGGLALRRHALRKDGFVSVRAGRDGGELVTEPLTFAGERLTLNFATSAAGGVRVGIETPDGAPLEGLGAEECVEQVGDELERVVRWPHGSEIGAHAGRAIRLRFRLDDADLYAIRFV